MDLIRPITWHVNLLSEHSHAPSYKDCLCCFGAAMVETEYISYLPHYRTGLPIPGLEFSKRSSVLAVVINR